MENVSLIIGSAEISLINGTNGIHMHEWEPSIIDYKEGGVFTESSLTDFDELVYATYDNGQEDITISVVGDTYNHYKQNADALLKIVDSINSFWLGTHTLEEMPYLAVKSDQGGAIKYAPIYKIAIPNYKSLFIRDFVSGTSEGVSVVGISLIINRGHYLTYKLGQEPVLLMSTPVSVRYNPTVTSIKTGLSTTTGAVLVTQTNRILLGNGAIVYISDNEGETWTSVTVPQVTNITALFQSESGYLLLGDNGGLIAKSFDNGETWETKTINSVPIRSFAETSTAVYASTINSGTTMYRSTNQGDTWSNVLGKTTASKIVSFNDEIYVSDAANIYKYDVASNTWLVDLAITGTGDEAGLDSPTKGFMLTWYTDGGLPRTKIKTLTGWWTGAGDPNWGNVSAEDGSNFGFPIRFNSFGRGNVMGVFLTNTSDSTTYVYFSLDYGKTWHWRYGTSSPHGGAVLRDGTPIIIANTALRKIAFQEIQLNTTDIEGGAFVANIHTYDNITVIGRADANGANKTLDYNVNTHKNSAITLFRSPMDIGDESYLGSHFPVNFHNFIFNITTPSNGMYLNGAHSTRGGWNFTIDVKAPTAGTMRKTGLHQINVGRSLYHVNVGPGTINGFWQMIRDNTGLSTVAPIVTGFPFGVSKPYIDVDGIPGTVEALGRIVLRNISDKPMSTRTGTTVSGGVDGWANRVIMGRRLLDRGVDFSAYLNLSGNQNPPGVDVEFYGTTYPSSGETTSGDQLSGWTATTSNSIILTKQKVIKLKFDGIAAKDYRGEFKPFLRYYATGTITGKVGLSVIMGSGSVAMRQEVSLFVGNWTVAEFDTISLESTDIPDELSIEIDVTLTTATSAYEIYWFDLILMPSDECIIEARDGANTIYSQLGFVKGFQKDLDITSFLPGTDAAKSYVKRALDGRVSSQYITITGNTLTFVPEIQQRFWVVALRSNIIGPTYYWTWRASTAFRAYVYANPRYTMFE